MGDHVDGTFSLSSCPDSGDCGVVVVVVVLDEMVSFGMEVLTA